MADAANAPAVASPPAAGAAPTPPAAPPKPAMPAKPAPAKPGTETRRGFFSVFTNSMVLAWTSFTAAIAIMTLGTARFMFQNVAAEPPNRVKIGEPGAFEDGKVTESFKDRQMWIVRYQGKIYALNTMCTHLGCTPNWLEADKKFKCPCHGSGFYITGINFEGPAPRPLERWAIERGDDGQLVVDKSKKFQYEMGQWDNKDSYFEV